MANKNNNHSHCLASPTQTPCSHSLFQANGSQSWVPQEAASLSPGNLLEMKITRPSSRCTRSDIQGVEHSHLCDSPSSDFQSVPRCEKKCHKLWANYSWSSVQRGVVGIVQNSDVLMLYIYNLFPTPDELWKASFYKEKLHPPRCKLMLSNTKEEDFIIMITVTV